MRFIVATLLAVFLLVGHAFAQPSPRVAELIAQYNLPVVGLAEVKEAMGDGFMPEAAIIDTRSQRLYDRSHIPTAIFMAEDKIEASLKALEAIAPQKSSPIIIYCGGFSCDKSPILGGKLQAMGYSNIAVYPAGMPEWEASGELISVGTEGAKAIFEEDGALFIDARPKRLFDQGSIAGALLIPDTHFERYQGRLPRDVHQPVVIFCQGYKCDKSAIVAQEMKKLGYTHITLYPAGYPAWKAAGLPTSDGQGAIASKPATPVVSTGRVQQGSLPGTVTSATMQELMKQSPDWLVIVDVRSEEEFKSGHIPGAIHISPRASREEFFAKLPKTDKEVILYCSTGARSFEAQDKLVKEWKHPLAKTIYALDASLECDRNNRCTFK